MSILNDDDFEVYEELIFNDFLLCNSIEIKGVVEEDDICEPVQKGERYDSVSLYLRFIEGHVMVVGDFGKHCLEQLHEIALDLSRNSISMPTGHGIAVTPWKGAKLSFIEGKLES